MAVETLVIYLGPEGRAILEPWLIDADPEQFVFSPRRSEDMRNRERSEQRVTPKYPSHIKRNSSKAEGPGPGREVRPLGNHVGHHPSVRQGEGEAVLCIPVAALEGGRMRDKYGLEHVRAVLGHSFATMSDHYSKAADKILAARVANEVG